MKFLWLLSLVIIVAACDSSKYKTEQNKQVVAKTIYIVRHAEKDLTDTTSNPPLTTEGKIRAEKLKNILKDEHIDAIYSTRYQRNINTVKPLADFKEIDIQIYAWTKWQSMIKDIRSNDENFIVICGHGDNILPMIKALGAEPPIEKLDKYEYDKIFVVQYSDSSTIEMMIY